MGRMSDAKEVRDTANSMGITPPAVYPCESEFGWLGSGTRLDPHQQRWSLVTLWRRFRFDCVWLVLYAIFNVACFYCRFSLYPRDTCVRMWPAIAKGSAELVLANCGWTLLSLCHRWIDYLRPRSGAASHVRTFMQLPLEKHRHFHTLAGSVVLGMSLVHSVAWAMVVYEARTCPSEEWQSSGLQHLPFLRNSGSVAVLLKRLPVWTGVAMVFSVMLVLPFTVACVRRTHFQLFARMHLLLLFPFLVLLLFHGAAQWTSSIQAPLWVFPPLVLYLFERRHRLPLNDSVGLALEWDGCRNACLVRVSKPTRFAHRHMQPGMFVYLQVPRVSRTEWHPFTIASAPEDPFVELHIGIVGEWTRAVAEFFPTKVLQPGQEALKMRLDGPFGTPIVAYRLYTHVAFIATGMGVTPFLSVIRHHLHMWRRKLVNIDDSVEQSKSVDVLPSTMQLIWVVRDLDHGVRWLLNTMEEYRDVTVGLAAAKALRIDVIVSTPRDEYASHHTHPSPCIYVSYPGGRPSWGDVVRYWLSSTIIHPEAAEKRAIFACGSRSVTSAIKRVVAHLHRENSGFPAPERYVHIDVFAESFS